MSELVPVVIVSVLIAMAFGLAFDLNGWQRATVAFTAAIVVGLLVIGRR